MHADIIICLWLFAWATPTDMPIESTATVSVFSIMSSFIVPRTAGMMPTDLTRLLLTQFRAIGYSRPIADFLVKGLEEKRNAQPRLSLQYYERTGGSVLTKG